MEPTLLLCGDDSAEYDALANDYYHLLSPHGIVERYYVDILVQDHWLRRRHETCQFNPWPKVDDPAANLAVANVIRNLASGIQLWS